MRIIAAFALMFFVLPATAQLIPEDAEVEKVADGYQFTEGPAAGPDGYIYFTDIPAELILKYDPQTGETETFREDTGQANGLMWFDGDLYSCCHKARAIHLYPINPQHQRDEEPDIFGNAPVQLDPLQPVVLIHRLPTDETRGGSDGRHHWEQVITVTFNSPNDLAIDDAGNTYFTDPRYGNRDSMETEIEGVYYSGYVDIDEPLFSGSIEVLRLDDDLTRPNGIVLSPDESILYVADHGTNEIFAYDIEAPGEIDNKRLFARLNDGEGRGGPDGLCVDAQGRVYAAGQNRIWVYNPDGSAAGDINVGPACTNCTFASDGKTLYITANRGLYRVELNTDESVAMLDGTPRWTRDGVLILPDIPEPPRLPDDDSLVLTVTFEDASEAEDDVEERLLLDPDGLLVFLIDETEVEEDKLVEELREAIESDPEQEMVLCVHSAVRYSRVLPVIEAIREAGLVGGVHIRAIRDDE